MTRTRVLTFILVAWAAIYGSLYALEHTQLLTNGYDLSVFDYALWSTLHTGTGQVPFLGHSLFAEHYMPTLLALLPIYALWQSPVLLLILELMFIGAAGVMLFRLASRSLPLSVAAALTAAFLLSRRTHSGIEGWFHVEALEPLLIFGAVWAADARRWSWFGACVLLALGCKEDVTVYLAMFGAYLFVFGKVRLKPDTTEAVRLKADTTTDATRVAGLLTVAVSVAWLAFAFLWAIPHARIAGGLPRANPFMEARFGDPAAPGVSVSTIVARLFSLSSASRMINVTSSVAFLCWAAPDVLAIALPGIAANLAGRADTLQAGLLGHYLWPILPWIFLAAIGGCARVLKRWPQASTVIAAVLVAITVLDSPLWRIVGRSPWRQSAAAAEIRSQLRAIPSDASVLSQASLIPQLPHRTAIQAIGRELSQDATADYVAISTVGDMWPLDVERMAELVERFKSDPGYDLVAGGPLYLFRRVGK